LTSDENGRRPDRWLADRDCCSGCGNQFPPDQVCGNCVTDALYLRIAVDILRRQMKRKTFVAGMFLRTLERHADRLERS
jgi:hypothetical protein